MNQTNAELAYQEIKKRIIRTELSPGAVINESDLMDELGFGRTPIREALKRLQPDDLVVVKPRRGIFVAQLAITDLTQIVEVRVELESLAVRLTCERITEDQLARLEKLANQYEKFKGTSKEEMIELDGKFHNLVREATNNRFLISNLEYYYNLSLRIWYLALPQTTVDDIDIKAHCDIYQAIAVGNKDLATEHITRHIQDFHKTIKNYL
ncbi:MAG: GntR family transcriptional regulator [Anaerolineales bacterium]|nr:GntR family transcriptional regulator [Anaerolineales bacterium]